MNRAGQFLHAVGAKPGPEDMKYIGRYLPLRGQELFFRMHPADQCHALRVARTAETLADGEADPSDREFLVRCALLHDVGRRKEDMGIWGKVAAVLIHSLAPEAAKRWALGGAERGAFPLRHVMYVYYHHPLIGAGLLEEAGFPDEAVVVAAHHDPQKENDSSVLRILRQADEMN